MLSTAAFVVSLSASAAAYSVSLPGNACQSNVNTDYGVHSVPFFVYGQGPGKLAFCPIPRPDQATSTISTKINKAGMPGVAQTCTRMITNGGSETRRDYLTIPADAYAQWFSFPTITWGMKDQNVTVYCQIPSGGRVASYTSDQINAIVYGEQ